MPKKMPEYLVYFLEDCLWWDSDFTHKHMFGGYAIYKYEKVFALYLKSGLYFKVDDNNRQDYISLWSEPFSYSRKSWKIGVMSYYLLPEEILEQREELEIWIEKSLSVPAKTKKKKTQKDIQFDEKILEFILTIPKGKVSSYKYLADRFWVHPRKIASVMKYNKSTFKYPCYKILADSGKIGWYNSEKWIMEKIEKLEADGVRVTDGKVDKKYFIV